MTNNVLREKSFLFAVRIVNLRKHLRKHKHESIISKQLLRSGTSIGANVREANNAVSKPDFVNKLGISQKETDESMYWLELLRATDYLTEQEFYSLHTDAMELMKLIRSSILTTKRRMQK